MKISDIKKMNTLLAERQTLECIVENAKRGVSKVQVSIDSIGLSFDAQKIVDVYVLRGLTLRIDEINDELKDMGVEVK